MESDLRRGLGWPAQHAIVNMWIISAFIVDCARAQAVAPIIEVGAQGPSRRAELRGHLPQNAFAQNSMLP